MLLHMYVVDDCLDVKNRQMSVNKAGISAMILISTPAADGQEEPGGFELSSGNL